MTQASDDNVQKIPIVVERVSISKREKVTGVVRLKKRVRSEDMDIDQPLTSVAIEVERVPVNRWIEAPEPVRQEGDTTIYPVIEEGLVIQKRLRLVEEVRVTRRDVTRPAHKQIKVQREEMIVERVSATGDQPRDEPGDRPPDDSAGPQTGAAEHAR